MGDHQTQLLYDSETLKIEAYHCHRVPASRDPEEITYNYEVVFTHTGTFVRRDAGGVSVADPNYILFFVPQRPFQISHPIIGGDRSTTFTIAPHALADIAGGADPWSLFSGLPIVVEPRHRLRHYRLLQSIRCGKADSLLIEEQALALLADVIQSIPSMGRRFDAHPPTNQSQADLIQRTQVVLLSRYSQQLSLTQIAAAVYSSPYHLARTFRRFTGLSLHRYLQRLRLLGALEHLADHPHAELPPLALDIGFASLSHFSASFRREFGFAPSALRRPLTPRALREMSKILKA